MNTGGARLWNVVQFTPLSDGGVIVRPPEDGDAALLVASRDEEFHRWLGAAADTPSPVGCIVVDGAIVGWVDYDVDHEWLEPGEVNVGYNVFASQRGNGYATRAVELLIHHLEIDTPYRTAMLLNHPDNERSLAVPLPDCDSDDAARSTTASASSDHFGAPAQRRLEHDATRRDTNRVHARGLTKPWRVPNAHPERRPPQRDDPPRTKQAYPDAGVANGVASALSGVRRAAVTGRSAPRCK